MEIRPQAIRTEAMNTMGAINRQIDAVEVQAKEMNIQPSLLKDTSGNFVLVPLLAAKAQCLHVISMLQRAGVG